MRKQYKTWEMIKAWQEGTRGRFNVILDGQECDEIVELRDDGIYVNDCEFEVLSAVEENKHVYMYILESVDFMTAVNSGKPIRPAEGEFVWLHPIDWFIEFCKFGFPTTKGLINNKWLIAED